MPRDSGGSVSCDGEAGALARSWPPRHRVRPPFSRRFHARAVRTLGAAAALRPVSRDGSRDEQFSWFAESCVSTSVPLMRQTTSKRARSRILRPPRTGPRGAVSTAVSPTGRARGSEVDSQLLRKGRASRCSSTAACRRGAWVVIDKGPVACGRRRMPVRAPGSRHSIGRDRLAQLFTPAPLRLAADQTAFVRTCVRYVDQGEAGELADARA